MRPIAIVLHGTSSSGKSSLAKALQAISPTPVFHVDMDAFECMTEYANFSANTERIDAFRLHCMNLQSTLRALAESPYDLLLDFVLRDKREFANCMKVLSERRPTYVIGVSCQLDVLEKRERIRGDRELGLAKRQFGHSEYNKPYSMRIDTTFLSPAEGAQIIREFISRHPESRYVSEPA